MERRTKRRRGETAKERMRKVTLKENGDGGEHVGKQGRERRRVWRGKVNAGVRV